MLIHWSALVTAGVSELVNIRYWMKKDTLNPRSVLNGNRTLIYKVDYPIPSQLNPHPRPVVTGTIAQFIDDLTDALSHANPTSPWKKFGRVPYWNRSIKAHKNFSWKVKFYKFKSIFRLFTTQLGRRGISTFSQSSSWSVCSTIEECHAQQSWGEARTNPLWRIPRARLGGIASQRTPASR